MTRRQRFDLERFLGDVQRCSRYVSARQLADDIGVSTSALMKTLRGEGGCSIDTAASLARWARLSLDNYVVKAES